MKKQKKKQIKIESSLKLLFKTSFFVLIGFFISKILAYSYRVIIARYFGAEIYGVYSLSLVIIGWFIAIASLGLLEGTLRYIPLYRGKKTNKQKQKIRYIFKISSLILIFSTIAITIVSYLSADFIALNIFHNSNLKIFLQIFSFMIPFWVFATYFLTILQAFEKIKQRIFIERIIQGIVKLSALIFLIYLGLNMYAILFSFFIGIFIIFLVGYFYCKYYFPGLFIKDKLKQKPRKELSKSLISYSWPVMFFGIIFTIFYWTDSFLIGFLKTATEVGYYNAAVPIALLLTITPQLFLQLLFPTIIREYAKKNMELIKETTKQISKWIFMINIPVLLLIIIFPGAIINLLFGAEYLVAENALRFLSIGALFSSVFIISNNLISMIGKSKLILFDIILATIVNILLNLLLIPKPFIFGLDNSLGLNGAAVATMISIIIFNLLFVIQAKHYTSIIPLRRKMLRVLLISLIPLTLLLVIKNLISINIFSILILTILFFALYFILLFLLKGFDRNDLLMLKTIKQKLRQLKKT
tara:strand:+ start:10718 stop:12301 length:1584 start_codon:yes stop_codon:yes gene_type:complete